jgi:hypothetical protein
MRVMTFEEFQATRRQCDDVRAALDCAPWGDGPQPPRGFGLLRADPLCGGRQWPSGAPTPPKNPMPVSAPAKTLDVDRRIRGPDDRGRKLCPHEITGTPWIAAVLADGRARQPWAISGPTRLLRQRAAQCYVILQSDLQPQRDRRRPCRALTTTADRVIASLGDRRDD